MPHCKLSHATITVLFITSTLGGQTRLTHEQTWWLWLEMVAIGSCWGSLFFTHTFGNHVFPLELKHGTSLFNHVCGFPLKDHSLTDAVTVRFFWPPTFMPSYLLTRISLLSIDVILILATFPWLQSTHSCLPSWCLFSYPLWSLFLAMFLHFLNTAWIYMQIILRVWSEVNTLK